MSAAKKPKTGNFPPEGHLILPNRLDASALAELETMLPGRRIIFLTEEGAPLDNSLKSRLERSNTQTLSFDGSPDSWTKVSQFLVPHLAAQGVAIWVPGGTKTRRGTLLHGRSDAFASVLSLNLPTLPLFVDRPRESMLSVEKSGDYADVALWAGPVLPEGERTMARFLEELLLLGEMAFSARPLMAENLAYKLLQGLKKHGSRAGMVDGMDGSKLGYDRVLAAAIGFALRLRELTDKPRVGIILPPGRAGLIANLAVLFAGKVPVNLNYTAGKEAVESAIRQAGIDRFITVDAFVRRMQRFPWPRTRDLIFLERELPTLKASITRWFLLAKVLPTAALASRLGIRRQGGDNEAVLLFTSGSSGEPKGVPLTHRNVLANTAQFAARLSLGHDDSLLGSLPLFHSFGCTVTLWYPVIEGITLVTFPSPLEVERIASLVQEHRVSLLLTTPTFLRGYLKRVKPDQLASLKMVITGAEKLPHSLSEAFEKRFGHQVLEGYGLTETSPVTNFNLPNLEAATGDLPVQPTHRLGSVGQFVPGLAVRVTDPVNDAIVPPDHSGILWFKGSNVFGGYLHWGEKNNEVVQDGWFRTGDIGRVDADGFLYIEGRLSRFSKIGGEMVPHERVEEYLVRALGFEGEEIRKIVVVGVPDETKGEALMLLSTTAGEYLEQEMLDLRYRLLEMNVPALWIPRKMIKVPEIPVLASGKLDLRSCELLAKNVQPRK